MNHWIDVILLLPTIAILLWIGYDYCIVEPRQRSWRYDRKSHPSKDEKPE